MRAIKLLLALALLPTLCFMLVETGGILVKVLGNFKAVLSFVFGAGVYAGIHYGWYNFSRMYVFIHEMTHALAALCCASRIKDIRVGQDSGYVKMDKTNAFIVLAPYFVPGYVLLVVFGYMAGDLFVDMTPYRQVFLFLIGFFTSFHFIQTFKTLFEADQPDLKLAGGKIFSVVIIILANMVVLALLLKGVFPELVSLRAAGMHVLRGTLNTWRILVNYIVEQFVNAL